MNRKLIIAFLYFYTLAFSVLKAVRFPNGWSEAHWMMDYRFGFIKRGLAGEIFGWFFHKNESSIFWLSVIILSGLYASLGTIALKQTYKNKGDFYDIVFFVLFFLSQYVVYSAHIIGYLDHVVFLLTILIIYLILKKKIFLSSCLLAFSIVIHEVSFFLALPICIFALIISQITGNEFTAKIKFDKILIKRVILFLMLPVLSTIMISLHQEILGMDNRSVIFNYLKNIDFVGEKVGDSVTSAYTRSFSYYFSEEKSHFLQRVFLSTCTIFYGIPILSLLYIIYKKFPKINISLFLMLAGAAFFPLLLHSIAWDTYRIWSFPFMIIFLGYWILNSNLKSNSLSGGEISLFETIIFGMSFLFVALIPNILMDEETERFSLLERVLIILPVIFSLFYLEKRPSQQ